MTNGKWWMQDSTPASLRALKDAPGLKEMLFIIPQDSLTTPGCGHRLQCMQEAPKSH